MVILFPEGRSGCGKSTLLYLLSTMDTDYEGQLLIHNELVTGQPDKNLARIEMRKLVLFFNFITCYQNIMF
jgi:lipoprotein-releasing system ATP-binding protein